MVTNLSTKSYALGFGWVTARCYFHWTYEWCAYWWSTL